MKNGECPRCKSRDIRVKHRGLEAQGSNGFYLSLSNFGSISMYSDPAELDTFICTTCGLVENYIGNPDLLSRVAEKWDRVAG